MSEVALIPTKETALAVFSAPNGLEPFLKAIRDELDSFVPNMSTTKGRSEIASMAHKVARSKTALDNVGKELVAELKDIPKKVDAERKRMRDLLDGWRDEVRAPLTEWEQAEERRVANHRGLIQCIDNMVLDSQQLSAIDIRDRINAIKNTDVSVCEEFTQLAQASKESALKSLGMALNLRMEYDQQQAELAVFRREAAEREARERDGRIAREAAERAELKAKADAEAAIKAEREASERALAKVRADAEAKLQAEREERREAELKVEREKQRVANEAAAAAREQAAREADIENRKRVNIAARDALVAAGITDRDARIVVAEIAAGRIPGVRISY